jgi:hypothetical protein
MRYSVDAQGVVGFGLILVYVYYEIASQSIRFKEKAMFAELRQFLWLRNVLRWQEAHFQIVLF